MPILDLQRRMTEKGRLRMGETRVSRSGKRYPAGLTTWRFTSPDRVVIDQAAERFGGQVQAWDGAPTGRQWEVISDTSELDVVVPVGLPISMLSQFYELWSGGGCERRCDSRTELLSDQPCLCDPDDRECQPTSRLSLLIPDLPGLGMWRLESHGWYAAAELAGVVSVLERAGEQGAFHGARLRIDQRTVKRPGEEPHSFVVPVLDIALPLRSLLPPGERGGIALEPGAAGAAGDNGDGGRGEKPARTRPAAAATEASPRLDPLPEPDRPPPSIADQVAGIGSTPRRRRADSPSPPPPTGIEPRTVIEADAGVLPDARPEPQAPPDSPVPRGESGDPSPPPRSPARATREDSDRRGTAPPPSITDPETARRRVMVEARKTWPDLSADDRDDLRHALGIITTFNSRTKAGEEPVASVSHMSMTERIRLSQYLADVRNGQMFLRADGEDEEGHRVFRCWVKGSDRTAILTRRAVDDWEVEVVHDQPEPEP